MSDRMCPISAFAPAGRVPSNDNYKLSSVLVMDAETRHFSCAFKRAWRTLISMGDAELSGAESGRPVHGDESQALQPDLSLRTWFSYFGRSPRAKWYLPLGLFGLGRMIMQMGVVVTLLIVVGILAVAMPLGYVLWRARGGGPDPG